MKKYLLLLLVAQLSFGQAGAPANPYYNGMNWTQTGMPLKTSLSTLTINKHTNLLPYVWNATQATDLDPSDSNNVLLIYGFSTTTCPTSISDGNDHRKRDVNSNGGGNSCEWNREHVYAKALGTPALDDSGLSDAGEDAHNLRSCDVDRNGNRGNLKFATGSGNSGTVTGGWYPGNEWKGDVARMMMYMYLRYPTQCLPINVGTGATVSTDTNMIQLFLQWNAEDPVSAYEDDRNTYHGNTSNTYAQGNRNPFIDNPYLATVIWGGPAAENRWPTIFLSSQSFLAENAVSVYPNPTNSNEIEIATEEVITKLTLVSINGQIIKEIVNPILNQNTYKINDLPQGFYFLQINAEKGILTKKIIVN
ncbi:endonuclease [Flavobacterium sp.]|jgi:endonuclease I|uniref:endonuclease n=1 Tax=Flavobacterium sp. TaxID=239 RepID=UPI0037BF1C1C